MERINREPRARKAEALSFVHAQGESPRPFYGTDRQGKLQIAVTPDLRRRSAGVWRVTRFKDGVPLGHAEFDSFKEAVLEAVQYHGLDLSTATRSMRDQRVRLRKQRGRRS
jgi:hypothetical protein